MMSTDDGTPSRWVARVSALNNRVHRAFEAGDYDEGLVLIDEAIALCRQRDANDSPVFAVALHNRSRGLAEIGRHDEALQDNEVAVAIMRPCAIDEPETFTPMLVKILTHSAVLLIAESPRRSAKKRAAKLAEEAVGLGHQYTPSGTEPVDANEDPPQIVLAMALNNLSLCLWHLDRHQQRVAALEQAVDIYRRFVALEPARWEYRLAESLDNLGVALQHAGHGAAALDASREAVRRFGDLALDRDVHEADKAGALENLTKLLWSAGEGEGDEALGASEEAALIYGELMRLDPVRYAADCERARYTLSALRNGTSPFR